MADNFAFDAPQYLDFAKDLGNEDRAIVEAYFNVDHENEDFNYYIDINEKSEYFSPIRESLEEKKEPENCLKKSLSYESLQVIKSKSEPKDEVDYIRNDINSLHLSPLGNNIHVVQNHEKEKPNLRIHATSNEHVNKLSKTRSHSSREDLQAQKYVSMAEAVNKFHSSTPSRFRSKPKKEVFSYNKPIGPIHATIPHSPALATKQRHRPVHIMSTEELEFKAFEEAKKYKIKTKPVNPKVLNGPVKPTVAIAKRPSTIPQPFNITTNPPKKPLCPTSPKVEFHANPVPKAVFLPPKLKFKPISCTKPVTPKLSKRLAFADKRKTEANMVGIWHTSSSSENGNNTSKLPSKTNPKPFSFETRDKEILKKKEEMLKKVMEEEKKAREFHARPLRRSILKSPTLKSNATQEMRRASAMSFHKNLESEEQYMFKAKPAKVLYVKPFEPKKEEKPLVEITEFQLNTDRRAKEREEFELKQKQKEERYAQLKKEREELYLQYEQEQIAKLRKEAEHKANPVRHYKEIQTVAVKPLTKPQSPRFLLGKSKNKENNQE